MSGPHAHCCDRMRADLAQACDVHPDPAYCPDNLIGYDLVFDEYGIWVHDDGQSWVTISFCPWCGTRLPSRKQEWFDTLERMGFDDPFGQDIPPEFKTDAWWRGRRG